MSYINTHEFNITSSDLLQTDKPLYQCGLAATRLTDNPQGPSPGQPNADIVDGLDIFLLPQTEEADDGI